MAAPKVAAIVKAYLGGYLSSGYPNGINSVIRENMILQALACKENANIVKENVDLAKSAIGNVENPKKYFQQLSDKLKLINDLNSFRLGEEEKEVSEDDLSDDQKRLLRLYSLLENIGFEDTLKNSKNDTK